MEEKKLKKLQRKKRASLSMILQKLTCVLEKLLHVK